jgi:hypothetical protein
MFRRIAVAAIAAYVAFANAPVRADEPAKTSTVVPVFRLDGPLTERPAGEELPIFDQPGTSLKDVIERMNKASKDPAV